jgi:hypothetical protein
MKTVLEYFLIALAIAACPPQSWSAERSVEAYLPAVCGSGLVMDGTPATYLPDTLYKYINGEAEMYLPYGFQKAATVLYIRPPDKGKGLVVNIFKMGSLLDSFGIYGNYRSPSSVWVKVGAEAFVEDTGLTFYQDRYFVQVMTSGSLTEDVTILVACAAAVSKMLPEGSTPPNELSYFNVPGLTAHSEKYFPEGLLGYKFLGAGMTAEVTLKGIPVKAFIVMGESPTAMAQALRAYHGQLKVEKGASPLLEESPNLRLSAKDPLYKGIIMEQSGRYAAGVAGLFNVSDGAELVKEMIRRLPQ